MFPSNWLRSHGDLHRELRTMQEDARRLVRRPPLRGVLHQIQGKADPRM